MSNLKTIKDILNEDTTPMGVLNSGETFGLEQEDRQGNMYVLGKSGQGKTLLLENIIVSDLAGLSGGLLLDPFGDIVDDVLPYAGKEDVIIFALAKGDAEFNINKFKREVDLAQIKTGKLVMCKLSYSIVGSHVSREVGLYILNEFYKLDDLRGASLFIDEFHNFVDRGENIAKNKELGVKCILADQTVNQYSDEGVKQVFGAVDHIVCFNVDKLTAEKVSASFGFKVGDLTAVEQYSYYARLTVGGEQTDVFKAKGVFPIPYPKR